MTTEVSRDVSPESPMEVDQVNDSRPQVESTIKQIWDHIRSLEKAVYTKEERYIWRVLCSIPLLRSRLTERILSEAIHKMFRPGHPRCSSLLQLLAPENPSEEDGDQSKTKRPRFVASDDSVFGLPEVYIEVEAYICLLIILFVRNNRGVDQAHAVAEQVYNNLIKYNRRTLDLLTSRVVFYMCFFAEQSKSDKTFRDYRQMLFVRLKACEQHCDHEGVAMVLNLLLRQYIRQSAFELAEKLVVRQKFPHQASNGQAARYLFYVGRVKAVRLEYTASYDALQCALQKAPEHGSIGFRQMVTKFLIVVRLLLSEIPEKNIFRHKQMIKSLRPYFQLVLSVRRGSIGEFNSVWEKHQSQFVSDETAFLIIRLRHNVIRSGIRNIGLAYSKISMEDVARKLQIDSAVEAELMVAKAIRNNLVSGKIDHDNSVLMTETSGDVYSSLEPYRIFRPRIRFCLYTYRKCVEALRFPPKKYYEDLAVSEEKQRLAYTQQIIEEDEDDSDDSDDTVM
ncbi:hypothetical protein ACOME3_007022 [Neoechinorhynchus agilis]